MSGTCGSDFGVRTGPAFVRIGPGFVGIDPDKWSGPVLELASGPVLNLSGSVLVFSGSILTNGQYRSSARNQSGPVLVLSGSILIKMRTGPEANHDQSQFGRINPYGTCSASHIDRARGPAVAAMQAPGPA